MSDQDIIAVYDNAYQLYYREPYAYVFSTGGGSPITSATLFRSGKLECRYGDKVVYVATLAHEVVAITSNKTKPVNWDSKLGQYLVNNVGWAVEDVDNSYQFTNEKGGPIVIAFRDENTMGTGWESGTPFQKPIMSVLKSLSHITPKTTDDAKETPTSSEDE